MLKIKTQAMAYLPREFVKITDSFPEVYWQRAGTCYRAGGFCTPILTQEESKKYWTDWNYGDYQV